MSELGQDFRIGEWVVSPSLNQIARNGTSARVEPKAMRVLVYLAEHPGVVSKEQLISAVWPDVFISDDVLPGCISALRKTFSDDARRPKIIETIHKSGYRLLVPALPMNGNGHGQRQDAVGAAPNQQRSIVRLAFIFGVLLVASVLVAAFAWPASRKYDSVAILPFSSEPSDAATQCLSDVIGEEVVNNLSQLSTVRVMAWATVSRYRQAQSDARAAGRDLGVKAILAGHLAKEGDRLILQTELVDVNAGSQLWGKRYEADAANAPNLEQQISEDIASNLRLRLTQSEQERIQHHYAPSPAAYQAYLKGRFFWQKRTKEGLDEAIQHFRQAIQSDPNYAAAYAGLADSYALLDDWGETAPRDSFPKARAAAQKAIALDDSLAEAHASLALVHEAYDWDWAAAEQEFKSAIELNPNYATAHQWYGLYLASMGRFSEAEAEARRARELDPLTPIVNMALPEVYTWQGRVDEAIAEYKKIIAMDPSFPGAHSNLAYMYERKHMYAEAVAEDRQHNILTGDVDVLRLLHNAHSASEYNEIMRQELKQDLDARAKGKYRNAAGIASYYANIGDDVHALEWLEKAYEEHSSGMQYLAVDPQFDQLRSNPKYQYWLGVLNLPKVDVPRT